MAVDLEDPFLASSRYGRDRHPPAVQMPPPREVDIRPRHGPVVHVEPPCHAHGHVHYRADAEVLDVPELEAPWRGRAVAGWRSPFIRRRW
jgi:hypothetical protein